MAGRTTMKRPVRLAVRGTLLLTLLALLVASRWAQPVLAHANLVRSDPASGAVLSAAPTQVQCWFSEQPDPHFSDIQVLNAERQRVDAGDMHVASGDPLSLIVDVKPNLPDGLYTVSWKTVSAVDGHLVNGNFPFYIGQPPQGTVLPSAAQTGPSSSGSHPTVDSVLVQWLSLLSAIVLMGGFTFWAIVLRPALAGAIAPPSGPGALLARTAHPELVEGTAPAHVPEPPRVAARRATRVMLIAWLVLASVTVVAALLQAHTATGAGLSHLFGAPLRTLLFQTRYGETWWLRSGATILLGIVLLARGRTQLAGRAALLLNALGALSIEGVFLAYSLNSHEAALTSDTTLATAVNLIHLTAAGFWLGGLGQFVLVVPLLLKQLDPVERLRFLAGAVPRFSTMAIVSVVALFATGIYQAVRQAYGWSALWETGWGRTLDLKLLLIVPLLLLGALNLLIVRPALTRAVLSKEETRRWRWLHPGHLQRSFLSAVAAESLLGAVILVVVGVLVNQPPPQQANAARPPGIYLTSKAESMTVKLDITPGQLGLNHFDAVVTDNGKPPPDGTQLVLRLTYADADLGTTELTTKAQGNGQYGADSSDLSTYGHWQILALVQPPNADEVRTDFAMNLSNAGASGSGSVASAATSVEKGKQLYMANCAQCHGADAHGDGPLAKNLNPPPVDLIVHVPQHSDQQLLGWITNGIPTTAMPAFGKKLNADQRQAILNYLRDQTKNVTPTPSAAQPSATPQPAATP